jgi:hypothetical protein
VGLKWLEANKTCSNTRVTQIRLSSFFKIHLPTYVFVFLVVSFLLAFPPISYTRLLPQYNYNTSYWKEISFSRYVSTFTLSSLGVHTNTSETSSRLFCTIVHNFLIFKRFKAFINVIRIKWNKYHFNIHYIVQKKFSLTFTKRRLFIALSAFVRVIFFIFVRWDFGYCGHYWPIVPAPDDR